MSGQWQESASACESFRVLIVFLGRRRSYPIQDRPASGADIVLEVLPWQRWRCLAGLHWSRWGRRGCSAQHSLRRNCRPVSHQPLDCVWTSLRCWCSGRRVFTSDSCSIHNRPVCYYFKSVLMFRFYIENITMAFKWWPIVIFSTIQTVEGTDTHGFAGKWFRYANTGKLRPSMWWEGTSMLKNWKPSELMRLSTPALKVSEHELSLHVYSWSLFNLIEVWATRINFCYSCYKLIDVLCLISQMLWREWSKSPREQEPTLPLMLWEASSLRSLLSPTFPFKIDSCFLCWEY